MRRIGIYPFIFILTFLVSCVQKDINISGNLVPKTVDEDELLPKINVNGTLFHCETFGNIQNPIIIFIPGGPGTDYSGLISQQGIDPLSRYPSLRSSNQTNCGLNQLQDEYYCVFFDPRGAGLSPRQDKGTHSLEQYHTDLMDIINHFIDKKKMETGIQDTTVKLAGHSFGGLYATSFINKYPEIISDVILFEPAPLTIEVYNSLIKTSVFSMINDEWLTEYLYSLKHMSYDNHQRADYHRILGFSESFPELEYPESVPLWRYGALVNAELEAETFTHDDFMITDNLKNFNGKVLFIWGEKTRALDEAGIKLQMSYFNNIFSAKIPNTGHYMVWEDPNTCVNEIRNFLQ
jgi:proline iminopeptidase